jgi:small subunit ribosomal protein S20
MPITKSAKKALRQSKKRRERNLRQLNAMREIIKQIRKLVIENKKEEALKLLPNAYKAIDKAAKTNVIKKNTAARKKSRLTKLISKTGAVKPEITPPKEDRSATAPSQTTPEQS